MLTQTLHSIPINRGILPAFPYTVNRRHELIPLLLQCSLGGDLVTPEIQQPFIFKSLVTDKDGALLTPTQCCRAQKSHESMTKENVHCATRMELFRVPDKQFKIVTFKNIPQDTTEPA